MCGIFGYIGARNSAPEIVLAGLKKLEYRGYDSWGIAATEDGAAQPRLLVEKHVGRIGQAATSLSGGHAAVGHTRWATHGGITDANAHPQLDCEGRLAVIHNGIVENYAELKQDLRERGHVFRSETDTEVICHLLEDELAVAGSGCEPLLGALIRIFRRLSGLNAVCVLDPHEQCIAVAKNGSPVVLGRGADGNYLASDSSALLSHTRRLSFLEDGQAAMMTPDAIAVFDVASGRRLELEQIKIWSIEQAEERAELDGHAHYMAKEIAEQPAVLRRLATERLADVRELARMLGMAGSVHLVGCGSAAHAAMTGEYLLSRIAHICAGAVVGSEFGHVKEFVNSQSLVVGLSQSGETIDLLDAMKAAGERGAKRAALVNVEGSTLYRLVDRPVLLGAGPERCVLATKSFTAKLGVLLLGAFAARDELETGCALVARAASEIQDFLDGPRAEQVRTLAERLAAREHLYVIGRGSSYPLALEAALKIKEVSYIHAEGFAGGELKHGVIALIEEGTPCLVLAPRDETFRAIVSGAEEIKARGGFIVGISPESNSVWDLHIPVADVGPATALVNAVPPQVLAYQLALLRGLDPDKPRNLAKSVTVR